MNIILVEPSVLPPATYGGTQRDVWYLGKELAKLGHKITFMTSPLTKSDFAKVVPYDKTKPFIPQMPEGADIVNFHHDMPEDARSLPNRVETIHGNVNPGDISRRVDDRTIFVSKNHALRHGSTSYVYNGMDWDDYGPVDINYPRDYFHFLGNAAWRIKNIKGAINTVLAAPGEKFAVMGGTRLNFKMGFRFTLSPRVRFYGMVGGQKKNTLLQGSKGLIFPVRWNEPMGLAIIESLYFGCPVLGTPYGALPELVPADVGLLSDKRAELTEAVKNINSFSRKRCHEYARDLFNSKQMALEYLKKFEIVLNGGSLNPNPPPIPPQPTEKFLPWYD